MVTFVLLAMFAGCATPPPAPVPTPGMPASQPALPATQPAPEIPPPKPPAPTPPATPEVAPAAPTAALPQLRRSDWSAVAGWNSDDLTQAWDAFITGCGALKPRPEWQSVCTVAAALDKPSSATLQQFFELNFTPYRVINGDGTDSGLITGYYEPLLHGSRTRTSKYRYPVYGLPDDLLVIDLSEVYPELKNMRLRGRLDGRRVVPYYSRAQIDDQAAPLAGRELAWVDDAVELFFLQIQGSGRIQMDNGDVLRVGYADQNGYPYRSLGRMLVDRGELPLERASMQGIKRWAKQNPDKLQAALDYNASYVFFRELPAGLSGPLGALGVALTAGRSIAVDARYVPLGAPVFLATTMPNSRTPLNRLMMAQDTGGAIRGGVRADFFWGYGDRATTLAGAMRQSGRMWVLLPNDYPPPAPGAASGTSP
jgi:membrane-bound lytic murein transglycosylase A